MAIANCILQFELLQLFLVAAPAVAAAGSRGPAFTSSIFFPAVNGPLCPYIEVSYILRAPPLEGPPRGDGGAGGARIEWTKLPPCFTGFVTSFNTLRWKPIGEHLGNPSKIYDDDYRPSQTVACNLCQVVRPVLWDIFATLQL
ncbi:hypothetical protein EVAR_18693_1 [Eumeta japonica]|uniref:Uncharacterized protein n=1 Tax=Eumeta variegata TaxID=151549 RepID=A0A4C1U6Q3_EUMVA|nr:hypothetical protein EVAR_18693_1 [Eumeta japonica]